MRSWQLLLTLLLYISSTFCFARVPDMRKFEALKQHLIRPLGSDVTLDDVDIAQLSPPINTFGKAGQNNGRLAFMRKIRQRAKAQLEDEDLEDDQDDVRDWVKLLLN